MKAVRFHEQGGLDVLRYEEAPDPVISDDEVLVRVRACALNHLDIWVRSTLPGIKLPHIGGSDVAGEVVSAGSRAGEFKAGERVVVNPALSCGRCEYCETGDDNLCASFDILGRSCDGGYAELVKAPARNVFPIAGGLSYEQAAAFPLVFLTAWHMLMSRARLTAGESVLIWGGGSGVGSAAIQIARLCGARAIATVGSSEKVDKARALGADAVINHREQDVAAVVKDVTGGRGIEVVFEHVGPATWMTSLKCMAKGGRLVTCGATTGAAVETELRFMYGRQLTLMGSMMGTRADFRRVAGLIGRGALKPVVDGTFPLKEAIEAQRRMESREFFGKIVLQV